MPVMAWAWGAGVEAVGGSDGADLKGGGDDQKRKRKRQIRRKTTSRWLGRRAEKEKGAKPAAMTRGRRQSSTGGGECCIRTVPANDLSGDGRCRSYPSGRVEKYPGASGSSSPRSASSVRRSNSPCTHRRRRRTGGQGPQRRPDREGDRPCQIHSHLPPAEPGRRRRERLRRSPGPRRDPRPLRPRVGKAQDLRIGHVRVHGKDGPRFHLPDAKTETGIRTVEMSPVTVEAVIEHTSTASGAWPSRPRRLCHRFRRRPPTRCAAPISRSP